jgi:hypothetical protein
MSLKHRDIFLCPMILGIRERSRCEERWSGGSRFRKETVGISIRRVRIIIGKRRRGAIIVSETLVGSGTGQSDTSPLKTSQMGDVASPPTTTTVTITETSRRLSSNF